MKKNYSQDVLLLAILSLTVTFLWVYLSIYRVLGKSEKPVLTSKQNQPLEPKLDESIFEELKKRKI